MKLPRLLEAGRVEVRVTPCNGAVVCKLETLDTLLAHLNEARKLLTGQDALTAAESRGREAGRREAAKIIRESVDTLDLCDFSVESLCHDILDVVPSPPTMEIEGCEWTYDDNEHAPKWDSSCGEAWCFIEGGPKENRVKFCHGCGKPIITAP